MLAFPEDAREVDERSPERTVLQTMDHAPFFAVLDAPPAPNDKLQAAFDRHATEIDSR